MNKREVYSLGYDRGFNVASWTDMPSIGDTLPRHIDWHGIGTIANVSDQLDAWAMFCSESESNSRDFSPFEFTAHAINESRDPETYWTAFDDGITAGMNAYRRKHYKLRDMRKAAREA